MKESRLYDRLKISSKNLEDYPKIEMTYYQEEKLIELAKKLNLDPENCLNFLINFAYLSLAFY